MTKRISGFYDCINRIYNEDLDMRESEIKKVHTKLIEKNAKMQIDDLNDRVNLYMQASDEIQNIDSRAKQIQSFKGDFDDIQKDLNQVAGVLSSNKQYMDNLQTSIKKRDFCNSLNNLKKIPGEIENQVKNLNFEIATKLLASFMKFVLNPKYSANITQEPKSNLYTILQKQLSPILIAKYHSFLHSDDKSTIISLQALGFLITCTFYNLPTTLITPNTESNIESNILNLFTEYLDKWSLDLLSFSSGKDVLERFVKTGNTLKLIKDDIDDYLFKLPFWPETPNFIQLKETITSQAQQFYQILYLKFCETKNLAGFFYKYSNVIQIDDKNAYDIIDNCTALASQTWGVVYPQSSKVNQIIVVVLFIDLFNKCSQSSYSMEVLGNLYGQFSALERLINSMYSKKQSLPDLTPFYIYASDLSIISKFGFSEKNMLKFKMTLFTTVYFYHLLCIAQPNAHDNNVLVKNYIPRVVSVISSMMINGYMRCMMKWNCSNPSMQMNYPMTECLTKITEILNSTYGKQLDKIESYNFACPRLIDLAIIQTFNGIYTMNMCEHLTKERYQKIIQICKFIISWSQQSIFTSNPKSPLQTFNSFESLLQTLVIHPEK